MQVAGVAAVPLSRGEAEEILNSEYLATTLVKDNWAYQVTFEGDVSNLATGVPLAVEITTSRVAPISLVLGGRFVVAARIPKVPQVMQMEALECGAACLAMILAYYGRWVPLEEVRLACGVSRDGSKAGNVVRAAQSYGLASKGVTCSTEKLRSKTFPCIIFWNFNHFVVLRGFKGKYALINDPAQGQLKVPLDQFEESFTGVVLLFEKTDAFEEGGTKPDT